MNVVAQMNSFWNRLIFISLQDIINAIMGKCDNFFGMVLPSSSLLILDFIYAASTIIDSGNIVVSFQSTLEIMALFCTHDYSTGAGFSKLNYWQSWVKI